ncbi:hypothetical protein J2X31_003389 [Flavobacterium arsenatis]|uniref:Uncharacterized protein n=1 Tax=Flavobacterium arsenatis TaxID=1484332 RepID=A0ABU1TTZ6_9FLAO|nr:hypothetical protein [Flavobacterium arsenatis]
MDIKFLSSYPIKNELKIYLKKLNEINITESRRN